MAKRDNDLEFSVNAAFDDERAVIDKVPLYLVNGSLGAGKTSVLEFLLQQSDYKGSRVIENEYANENIDGYRLEGLAEMVTTLAGDCVCCSSKHALTRMLLDHLNVIQILHLLLLFFSSYLKKILGILRLSVSIGLSQFINLYSG